MQQDLAASAPSPENTLIRAKNPALGEVVLQGFFVSVGKLFRNHDKGCPRPARRSSSSLGPCPTQQAKFLGAFDETNSGYSFMRVRPVSSRVARRLPEQPFAFIKPDGFNIHPGAFCELADLHKNRITPCTMVRGQVRRLSHLGKMFCPVTVAIRNPKRSLLYETLMVSFF